MKNFGINLFLFLILPCLAVWGFGAALIRQNADLVQNQSMAQLEENAERICTFFDPTNFFRGHFKQFAESIDWTNIDPEKIEGLFNSYSGKSLGFVPYVFKNGELVTPTHLLDGTGERISDMWLYLHGRSPKTALEVKTATNALFGKPIEYLKELLDEGEIIEFAGHKGRGMLFVVYQDKISMTGIIFVSWTIPEVERLASFLPASYSQNIKIRIESRGQESKNTNTEQEWLSVRKIAGGRYIHFKQRFPELSQGFARSVLYLLIIVLAMVLATIMKDVFLQERLRNLSVKFKLVALIFYALILPLAGLLYFGWKYVAEHRELLNQEALIACQNSLNDLENGFEKEKFKILNYYRSFKNLPDMATNTQILQSYFTQLQSERLLNFLEVRDINTEILVTTRDPDTAGKIGIIAKVLARKSVNNYLSHRLPLKQTFVPSASEIMLQELLEGQLGGWARIFESPDELHEVVFGGYKLFWYWDIFMQLADKPAFILCDQDIKWSVRKYFAKTLTRRSTHNNCAVRHLVWEIEDAEWVAGDIKFADGVKDFVGQVRRNNSPQNGQLEVQGEKWLIAGAPGKLLAGNIILGLYPLAQIDRQIEAIVSDLAWGVVLALALALLIVRLFSNTIINPLTQIMIGVKALRRRDTSQKIAILQNDELGRLSATFNQTIENLEDVLFAKQIQALLIPESAPLIDGYSADIFSLPAADLGSAYCDIQAVNAEQWLIVIGDVNGHGVSSSLVTAMAKSVVSQCLIDHYFSMNELLTCMNELLYSQFKCNKCMTMLTATLDQASGRMRFAGAGHALPLYFSNGISKSVSELLHAPLGASSSATEFPMTEIVLNDGDCIIFYTEACVELRDKTGKRLGIDGFAALCRSYLHLPPLQMREQIVARLLEIAKEELDDDLTLMILQKCSVAQSFN